MRTAHKMVMRPGTTDGQRGPAWAVAAGLAALLVVAAACGSSGHAAVPQGLEGHQVGASPRSPIAAEERAAATVLRPAAGSYLAGKTTVTVLGSTTPAGGDINPYAIWPVAEAVGSVRPGDVLVDNFNDASNNQGTGTTIVDVSPGHELRVFADLPRKVGGCPGGVGLSTAMVQLTSGWVLVGSAPSANGQVGTAGAGCLLVLSPTGRLAGTIAGPSIDGPWDATVREHGSTATLFVANTLADGVAKADDRRVDAGDVVRLTLSQSRTRPPKVTAETTVASGLPEAGDASAFVKGPTGLALGADGALYVADNLDNRIAVIPDALDRHTSAEGGRTLTTGGQLDHPLGMVVAPDGDLLVANASDGKIVEISPSGRQLGEFYADDQVGQDPPGNGDLFDVAIDRAGTGVLFVNDGTNTLELLH